MRKFISYILYNLKLLRYFWSKPDFKNDNNLVRSLRQNGIIIISDFENYSQELKKLNTFTDNLNINEIINNKNHLGKNPDDIRGKLKKEFRTNITDLYDKELLLKFSKNKFIDEIVSQYFGFSPSLRNISVWIDTPNEKSENPVATQIFHRDFDDIKLIKIFLYLNNVNAENGPFEFISGSHKKPWLNYKNINNEEILRKFDKQDLISAIGKKNTLIFADTNGFHHGKKLVTSYRVMLTISFTSNKPVVKINNSLFG